MESINKGPFVWCLIQSLDSLLDAHSYVHTQDCQLDKQGILIGKLRLGVGSERLSSTVHLDWCVVI